MTKVKSYYRGRKKAKPQPRKQPLSGFVTFAAILTVIWLGGIVVHQLSLAL